MPTKLTKLTTRSGLLFRTSPSGSYYSRQRCLAILCVLVAATTTQSCRREHRQSRSHIGDPGSSAADTSAAEAAVALDVSKLATDRALLRKMLTQQARDAMAELRSLKLEVHSSFVFSRGGKEYEQADVSKLTRDPEGNFTVSIQTPITEVEVFMVGDSFFVREDKGRLRMKSRESVDAEKWPELVFSSLRQAVEPFGSRFGLGDPRLIVVEGRPATSFTVRLLSVAAANAMAVAAGAASSSEQGEHGSLVVPIASANGDTLVPESNQPVPPLSRWREQVRPLALSGTLVVDNTTMIVLRAELQGRAEIADRTVRATQLALRYNFELSDIGRVAALTAPQKSIPEISMPPSHPDLIGFFREEIAGPGGAAPGKPAAEDEGEGGAAEDSGGGETVDESEPVENGH